jgi:hypothetical protein
MESAFYLPSSSSCCYSYLLGSMRASAYRTFVENLELICLSFSCPDPLSLSVCLSLLIVLDQCSWMVQIVNVAAAAAAAAVTVFFGPPNRCR